jgi:hypothetical protein
MSTAPSPVTAAPKVSWLKHIGNFFVKLIKIVATDVAPAEKIAVPVAEGLLPEFIPLITTADGIFSKIVSWAVSAETAVASGGATTGGGPQKLAAVLTNLSPVLDQWVASNFPGAKQVSDVQKAGLINAVVAILNEIDAPVAAPPPTA